MRKIALGVVVALSALCTIPGKSEAAGNILYYSDFTLGTDEMAAALAGLPVTDTTTTATSGANFASLLGGGGYNLAILFVQGNFSTSGDNLTAETALATFIAGGGKAIGDDWDGANATVAPFQASFTGGTNNTPVTVSDPNLTPGVSSPMSLFNPGWGTWTYGLNALVGGSVSATFATSDGAIIAGNGGKTYLNGFLSDTFSTPSDGINLYTNEINTLLKPSVVPEPSSIIMGVTGLVFGLIVARRRRKAA